MAPQTSVNKDGTTQPANKIPEDAVQVDDVIYDAVQLAKIHPGGELFVKSFAGRDATEAFLSYHRRSFPHDRVAEHKIGNAPSVKDAGVDADYLELCALIEQIQPRAKSFAPFHYYLKLAVILGVSVGLEFYMHYTGNYKWYISAVLGWFLALIGLNVQHDANHGSISRNPLVNRVLGWSQNWIGGSAVDWIHQHVVQHHVDTNDIKNDPDISGSDIIRFNPLKPLMKHQIVQHIYVFLLILVFGYMMIFTSLDHIIKGIQFTPFSKLVNPYRKYEVASSLLFIFRWFVLPYLRNPSIYTYLHIAPMFVIGGYYLAFFFILSHNFVGVHMFDKSAPVHTQSFLYKQVTSSSNVGGPVLAFFNGGLNYQIEHHLFPRMQHSYYAKIAPVVREFCKKKNIPYVHFPTVADNFFSCCAHLRLLGSTASPKIPTNQ